MCVCVCVCVCACVHACVTCAVAHLVAVSSAVLPHVTIECLLVLEELVALCALKLSVAVTRVHQSEEGRGRQ